MQQPSNTNVNAAIMQFWPIIAVLISYALITIVWALRVEGNVRLNARIALDYKKQMEDKVLAVEARALDRHDEMVRLITSHYATKNEVSQLRGSVDTLVSQMSDVKGSMLRVETKIDTALVAALHHWQAQHNAN